MCDGDRDCSDGSDENSKRCGTAPPDPPKTSGHQNRKPPPKTVKDSNGNDIDLENFVCPHNLFTCHNKECVLSNSKCDGTKHCSDGSDEWDCGNDEEEEEEEEERLCPIEFWECDSQECIPHKNRCDGSRHCHDGSDERDCSKAERIEAKRLHKISREATEEEESECPEGMFRCNNGACVPEERRCDGKKQCYDGSDEWACIKNDKLKPKKFKRGKNDEL